MLLALVAVSAWVSVGIREYLHPARAWRRAIGGAVGPGRLEAWGQAKRGRIEGLDRERTLAEVARAMERGDADSRASAVVAFAFNESAPRVAVPRLANRLADPDAAVRLAAAKALRVAVGPRGEGRDLAVHELAAARTAPDPDLRRQAVEALGAFADRAPIPDDPALGLIRESLATDPDLGVRIASALALSRVGVVGDGAVALLRDYVRDHSGFDCTKPDCPAAFLALANLLSRSDEATAGLIERAARRDPGAVDAESTLTTAANQDDAAHARVETLAAAATRQDDPEIQAWAATLLLKIGSARPFLAIDDSPTRRRAGRALASAGRVDLRVVAALELAAADPDPTTRSRAVETLRTIAPGRFP